MTEQAEQPKKIMMYQLLNNLIILGEFQKEEEGKIYLKNPIRLEARVHGGTGQSPEKTMTVLMHEISPFFFGDTLPLRSSLVMYEFDPSLQEGQQLIKDYEDAHIKMRAQKAGIHLGSSNSQIEVVK